MRKTRSKILTGRGPDLGCKREEMTAWGRRLLDRTSWYVLNGPEADNALIVGLAPVRAHQ